MPGEHRVTKTPACYCYHYLCNCAHGHRGEKTRFDQDGMKTAALGEKVLIKAANKEQIVDIDYLCLPLHFDKAGWGSS